MRGLQNRNAKAIPVSRESQIGEKGGRGSDVLYNLLGLTADACASCYESSDEGGMITLWRVMEGFTKR